MLNYYPLQQKPIYPGIRAVSPGLRSSSISQSQPYGVGSTYHGKAIYTVIQETNLGKGTFGSVKMVKEIKTGKLYAMKIISKEKVKKYGAEENIKREITLQSKLNHKNILKLHENFEDKLDIFMILELCPKGNLYQLLKKKKKLTEVEAFQLFYQICQALEYLHLQGIVHRDLKPENILFFDDKHIKICDYNWAKKLEPGQKCDPVICGTTEYMPPEVVEKRVHDHKVDIWSLGIMLYEFFHGELPFKGQSQREKINAILCTSLKFNNDLPLDLQILIHQMLSRADDHRLTIGQVMKSKWVTRMSEDPNYSTPPRPQTTYTKNRGQLSNRLSSFFSNLSQQTTSTGISKSRYQSNDKLGAPPIPISVPIPKPVPPKENTFKFKQLSEMEKKLKELQSVKIVPVPVKALGASNCNTVFGTVEDEDRRMSIKRATSYQPRQNPLKS